MLHPTTDHGVHRVSAPRAVRRRTTLQGFPTDASPSRAFPSASSGSRVTALPCPLVVHHLAGWLDLEAFFRWGVRCLPSRCRWGRARCSPGLPCLGALTSARVPRDATSRNPLGLRTVPEGPAGPSRPRLPAPALQPGGWGGVAAAASAFPPRREDNRARGVPASCRRCARGLRGLDLRPPEGDRGMALDVPAAPRRRGPRDMVDDHRIASCRLRPPSRRGRSSPAVRLRRALRSARPSRRPARVGRWKLHREAMRPVPLLYCPNLPPDSRSLRAWHLLPCPSGPRPRRVGLQGRGRCVTGGWPRCTASEDTASCCRPRPACGPSRPGSRCAICRPRTVRSCRLHRPPKGAMASALSPLCAASIPALLPPKRPLQTSTRLALPSAVAPCIPQPGRPSRCRARVPFDPQDPRDIGKPLPRSSLVSEEVARGAAVACPVPGRSRVPNRFRAAPQSVGWVTRGSSAPLRVRRAAHRENPACCTASAHRRRTAPKLIRTSKTSPKTRLVGTPTRQIGRAHV